MNKETMNSLLAVSGAGVEETYQLHYEIARNAADPNSKPLSKQAELAIKYGLNKSTIDICIRIFKAMRAGKGYRAKISFAKTIIFLQNIHKDYGDEGFEMAIKSLGEYVKYCENKNAEFKKMGKKSLGVCVGGLKDIVENPQRIFQ